MRSGSARCGPKPSAVKTVWSEPTTADGCYMETRQAAPIANRQHMPSKRFEPVRACPVKAVKAWLAAAGITDGPLFRPTEGNRISQSRLAARSVADIVKSYAGRLGLNVADFSGHSLRSGFLTSAARRGASVFKMRDVSRHKSMDVLQAYVRDADLFRDHAGAGLL
jgi:integrase